MCHFSKKYLWIEKKNLDGNRKQERKKKGVTKWLKATSLLEDSSLDSNTYIGLPFKDFDQPWGKCRYVRTYVWLQHTYFKPIFQTLFMMFWGRGKEISFSFYGSSVGKNGAKTFRRSEKFIYLKTFLFLETAGSCLFVCSFVCLVFSVFFWKCTYVNISIGNERAEIVVSKRFSLAARSRLQKKEE